MGSEIGHFSQVNHQMIAASREGSRGEFKGGVGSCGRFRSQVSPPGCSLSVLDAALLACASIPSDQLFHMDCTMHLAACAAGCVRARHALGSGVPRRSMHGCTMYAAHVHARHVHTSMLDFALIWVNTVYKLSRLVVLQR